MRKGLFFILMLILSFALAACGSGESSDESENNNSGGEQTADSKWSQIQEEGEIVVGTSGTLFPASYYPENSDKLTGYDVEIMREVAKRLDLDLKFEEYGVDGLLAAIKSGRVDAVINDMEVTQARQKQFAFSEPYKYSYSTMIVRESNLSGIKTLEDIEGKVHAGGATTVFAKIAEHLGAAKTQTFGNATNDIYLRKVEDGTVDFIINDFYLQTLALKALPKIDVQLHPDLKFHPTNSAIVMPKGASKMEKKINATLQEMRKDGTLTKLSKEFFGGKDASKKPDKDIRKLEGLESKG